MSAFYCKKKLIAILVAISSGMVTSSVALAQNNQQVIVHNATTEEPLWFWLSNVLASNNNMDQDSLLWSSKLQKRSQRKLKASILQKLKKIANSQSPLKQERTKRLIAYIETLPVTGRINLPLTDARLLQMNPKYSPVLQKNDIVKIFKKNNTVTVITDSAQFCQINKIDNAEAREYLDTCNISANTVSVIKPNGEIIEQSTSHWNAKNSITPPAGSIIWAAESDLSIFSNNIHSNSNLVNEIAEFLSTQGTGISTDGLLTLKKKTNNSIKLKPESRDLPLLASDWGIVGLMQTPTARMRNAGSFHFGYTNVSPYSMYNVIVQPFDNLEVAMRFVDIDDRKYGGADDTGELSLKDKSLDVKVKVIDESKWLPAMAIGFRDPLGTGLFNGEYIVANKRLRDLDFSLGLGFGYMGARADIDNPLTVVSDRFKERINGRKAFGGRTNEKSWFTGKGAVFGGIQWHTPYNPLTVKLEYDGNDYKNEPAGQRDFKANSPINLGLNWQKNNVEVNFGYERGNQFMLGIALGDNFANLIPAQKTPKFVSFLNADSEKYSEPSKIKGKYLQTIKDFNKASGLYATSINNVDGEWRVAISNGTGSYLHKKLDKGMAILNRDAGIDIKHFHIDTYASDTKIQTITLDRNTWITQNSRYVPPEHKSKFATINEIQKSNYTAKRAKKIEFGLRPAFSQNFGGPDGYLYSVKAKGWLNVPLWNNAWFSGSSSYSVLNNHNKSNYLTSTKLPQVRSDVNRYTSTSKLTLDNAQFNQLIKITPDLYALGYLGYLEYMYGGAGAEILYRPNNSNWALGLDANHVIKRDYDQGFGFRELTANTGHLNFYWDTKWHKIQVKAKAGKYLAGDNGVTLDLSRKFDNGLEMGAWATKTNVSAEEFGEGSFDKGIYMHIPFEAFVENVSKSYVSFVWQPILRDGGAPLSRNTNLWSLTHTYDDRLLDYKTKDVND